MTLRYIAQLDAAEQNSAVEPHTNSGCTIPAAVHCDGRVGDHETLPNLQEDQPIPPRKPIPAPPAVAASVPAADRASALQLIRDEIGDCTRCALHKGRNKLVFADGDPNARLMFVGEGPGADEDAQGLPFVGRAGQLLNNMIAAMGLKREQVYIANIVKCRPPGNRTPEPDEANTCSQFLFRQIDVVRPQVLVALGATAATYLLGRASRWPACVGGFMPTAARSSSSPIIRPICCATRGRKKKPGPICRLPCGSWDLSRRAKSEARVSQFQSCCGGVALAENCLA